MTITISDKCYNQILDVMKKNGESNKSKAVQGLIEDGLVQEELLK
jgi:hypothetical protein